MVATTKFDAADYLDTTERQAEYIRAALETGDAAFVRVEPGRKVRPVTAYKPPPPSEARP